MEEAYHLGKEMEGFDTELYASEKAIGLARKYITRHREIRQVWILSDNLEAVSRIRTTKAGPGQYMVLYTGRRIYALQSSNVKVTVQ